VVPDELWAIDRLGSAGEVDPSRAIVDSTSVLAKTGIADRRTD
jgi:hypothetical protein